MTLAGLRREVVVLAGSSYPPPEDHPEGENEEERGGLPRGEHLADPLVQGQSQREKPQQDEQKAVARKRQANTALPPATGARRERSLRGWITASTSRGRPPGPSPEHVPPDLED